MFWKSCGTGKEKTPSIEKDPEHANYPSKIETFLHFKSTIMPLAFYVCRLKVALLTLEFPWGPLAQVTGLKPFRFGDVVWIYSIGKADVI